MKRISITLIFLLSVLAGQAQDTLSLFQCLDDARLNAPRLRDSEIILSGGELRQENAGINWLPSLNLNGKATWQSDVVELSLEGAPFTIEIPSIPKDQYAVTLDVRQMIYDGGLTKKLKELERSSTAVDLQQIEIDLFATKDQVSQVYFTILILQENRKNLEISLQNLKDREKILGSAIENGICTENDLNVVKVETLKLLQALIEIDSRKKGLIETMSMLTGTTISENAVVAVPFLELKDSLTSDRPELEMFRLQQQLITATEAMKKTERMPKLYAFGQAGYGRPGYNMLSSTFDTYYMAGVMLQWNIWDWNRNNRDRQLLEQKKEILGNAEDQFNRQIRILTLRELNNMEQYKNALELDEHIVELQKEVSKNAASQLENGVINSSDYLLELNRETLARISMSVHRLQGLQSLANVLILNGKL